MTTLKATTLALSAALPLLALSLSSQAAMSPQMENALVEVCKSAKSNSLSNYSKTIKSHNLQNRTVALKVMCNGEDIISFAEHYGADRTATKLQNSIGNVSITDVAAITKINVTFEE